MFSLKNHHKLISTVDNNFIIHDSLSLKLIEKFLEFREKYGPVDRLDTSLFLAGPNVGQDYRVNIEHGKWLDIQYEGRVSDPHPKTGMREISFLVNGQHRLEFKIRKTCI